MSILIKGMEMPEKCGKCRFATAFECEVTKNFITTFNVRQVDCPLVPVPPLIDADVLEREIDKNISIYYQGNCGGYFLAEDAREEVEFAPTIIPAE